MHWTPEVAHHTPLTRSGAIINSEHHQIQRYYQLRTPPDPALFSSLELMTNVSVVNERDG